MKKFDADDDHEKKYNPNIILKHRMPALALCCLVRRPVGLKFKERHLNKFGPWSHFTPYVPGGQCQPIACTRRHCRGECCPEKP